MSNSRQREQRGIGWVVKVMQTVSFICLMTLSLDLHASDVTEGERALIQELVKLWRTNASLQSNLASQEVATQAGELSADLSRQGRLGPANMLKGIGSRLHPVGFRKGYFRRILQEPEREDSAFVKAAQSNHFHIRLAEQGHLSLNETKRRITSSPDKEHVEEGMLYLLRAALRPDNTLKPISENKALEWLELALPPNGKLHRPYVYWDLWILVRGRPWGAFTKKLQQHVSQSHIDWGEGNKSQQRLQCQMHLKLGEFASAKSTCNYAPEPQKEAEKLNEVNAPDPYAIGKTTTFAMHQWSRLQWLHYHLERRETEQVFRLLEGLITTRPVESDHTSAESRSRALSSASLDLYKVALIDSRKEWLERLESRDELTYSLRLRAVLAVLVEEGRKKPQIKRMLTKLNLLREQMKEEGLWKWDQQYAVWRSMLMIGDKKRLIKERQALDELVPDQELEPVYAIRLANTYFQLGDAKQGTQVLNQSFDRLFRKTPKEGRLLVRQALRTLSSGLLVLNEGSEESKSQSLLMLQAFLANLELHPSWREEALKIGFFPDNILSNPKILPLLVMRPYWSLDSAFKGLVVPNVLAFCQMSEGVRCKVGIDDLVKTTPKRAVKMSMIKRYVDAYLNTFGERARLDKLLAWTKTQDAMVAQMIVSAVAQELVSKGYWMPISEENLGVLDRSLGRFDATRKDYELFFRVNWAMTGNCKPMDAPLYPLMSPKEHVPYAKKLLRKGLDLCMNEMSHERILAYIKRLDDASFAGRIAQEELLMHVILGRDVKPQHK